MPGPPEASAQHPTQATRDPARPRAWPHSRRRPGGPHHRCEPRTARAITPRKNVDFRKNGKQRHRILRAGRGGAAGAYTRPLLSST